MWRFPRLVERSGWRPGYIEIDLRQREFEVVIEMELVRSEKALAACLVRVLSKNYCLFHRLRARNQETHIVRFDNCARRVEDFIAQMHQSERYRFCSFFADTLAHRPYTLSRITYDP